MGKFTKATRALIDQERQDFVLERVAKGMLKSKIVKEIAKTYKIRWSECFALYDTALAAAGIRVDKTTASEYRARIMAMIDRVLGDRFSKPRDLLNAGHLLMELTGCGAADRLDITLTPGGFGGVARKGETNLLSELDFEQAPPALPEGDRVPALRVVPQEETVAG